MENNGKGIFYGVIGVATLIVAIIGATFAFFTATNSNADVVAGTAAQAGLNLNVTEVTENTGVMVPQLAGAINTATAGTGGQGSCIDANGNTACKVYKVTIENTGSSVVVLTGTITFTVDGESSKFANLRWAKSDAATSGFGTVQVAIGGTASTDLYHDANGTVELAAADASANAGGDFDDFYIVVFIDEIGSAQEKLDTGSFKGTISFNSSAGGGVTSTFTATA